MRGNATFIFAALSTREPRAQDVHRELSRSPGKLRPDVEAWKLEFLGGVCEGGARGGIGLLACGAACRCGTNVVKIVWRFVSGKLRRRARPFQASTTKYARVNLSFSIQGIYRELTVLSHHPASESQQFRSPRLGISAVY